MSCQWTVIPTAPLLLPNMSFLLKSKFEKTMQNIFHVEKKKKKKDDGKQ